MQGKKQTISGKKVLVLGLGLHPKGSGISAANYFARLGAQVVVSDLKSREELRDSIKLLPKQKITFHLGQHNRADVKWADLIIYNPAISPGSPIMQYVRQAGRPHDTDVSFFLKQVKPRVIGITGTRGKSTTVSLVQHLIKKSGRQVFLGGNIGRSPLQFLPMVTSRSLVVLELSSWMLESLKTIQYSPPISLVTNIYPDHLDQYKSYKQYKNAKSLIFRYQGKKDIAIVNADDKATKALLPNGRRFWEFSIKQPVKRGTYTVHDEAIFEDSKTQRIALPRNKLGQQQHMRSNIAAAITVAKLLGIKSADITAGLKTFRGLPHRLQTIKTYQGVKYINDAHSTTPTSAIVAIKESPGRIILIAGGVDKQLSYTTLARVIVKRQVQVILLPGSASKKLTASLKQNKRGGASPAKTLGQGIKQAVKLARPGDTVLFSPAAASFNQYNNAEERGRHFIKIVKGLR